MTDERANSQPDERRDDTSGRDEAHNRPGEGPSTIHPQVVTPDGAAVPPEREAGGSGKDDESTRPRPSWGRSRSRPRSCASAA